LQTDRQTRFVHHREHRAHALVLLADQPAGGIVEIDDAGGRGLDAHFMLDAAQVTPLAPEAAVGVLQKFRHQEQADAANAGRRIGRTREHEVNNILARSCSPAEMKSCAGDFDAGIVLRFGFGADKAEIGAALRLGKAHSCGQVRR